MAVPEGDAIAMVVRAAELWARHFEALETSQQDLDSRLQTCRVANATRREVGDCACMYIFALCRWNNTIFVVYVI